MLTDRGGVGSNPSEEESTARVELRAGDSWLVTPQTRGRGAGGESRQVPSNMGRAATSGDPTFVVLDGTWPLPARGT
jgi:hypothetical protein